MKDYFTTNTSALITMCYIFDELDEFNLNLHEFLNTYNKNKFLPKLNKFIKNEDIFELGKLKNFYSENKSVIDIINKFTNLDIFFNCYYDLDNNKPNEEFYNLYNYLSENKKYMDKILMVLHKINDLGFEDINIDKKANYTDDIYSTNPNFKRNSNIIYLDNMEVIPNYKNHIIYKSNSSDYKITLGIENNNFSKVNREITVNNLLFDPNRLPKKIDKENIFEPFLKLKKDEKNVSNYVKTSVDLFTCIELLNTQLEKSEKTIKRMDNIKSKNELLKILYEIKENIVKMEDISKLYDEKISSKEDVITKNILDDEKKEHLERINKIALSINKKQN